MKINRRNFVKSSLSSVALAALPSGLRENVPSENRYEKLDHAIAQPVLKSAYFKSAVVIEDIQLLRYKNNFIVKVRSREGAEGYAVCNNAHMVYLYPIVIQRIIPFFLNKDARDLPRLIDEVYVYKSSYKLQGLALWISLASVEFAILDMLGRIAGKSIGELIGEIHNPEIAVYRANNYRGKTAEESIERIKKNVRNSGARAVKFKIGGRMRNNRDDPPGRTEKLIPLVREAFGEKMTIYADSNGSYTVDKAIEVGRVLEQHKIDFYEEPVPFDWLEETKAVADALEIPIAGGEQEPSMHNFRWLIAHDALQIVQPDMFYFGGMIRSMRVALMAHAAGKICTPHISGSGLGYVYMLHFVSALPNAGPFHEFKGVNLDIPFECKASSLKSESGVVTAPIAPGLGLQIDPDFIRKHRPVSA